jgi:hypothetical protein
MGTWVSVPYWPLMRPTTSCTMLRGGKGGGRQEIKKEVWFKKEV